MKEMVEFLENTESILGFTKDSAVTTVCFSLLNHLSVVQSNNTQEVLSRQVTPEAGAFDFTCDNSFSQQGFYSASMLLRD